MAQLFIQLHMSTFWWSVKRSLHPVHCSFNFILKAVAEQIGVKYDHNTAFCDEELKFGTVVEEAKLTIVPNIINHNYIIDGGFNA